MQNRGGRGGGGRNNQRNGNANSNKPTPAQMKSIASGKKLASLFEGVKPEEMDPTVLNNNRKWLGQKTAVQQGQFRQQRDIKQRGRDGGRGGRPSYDMWGDQVSPDETENPWVTDALYFKYENPHTESKREAKPITFPSNRVNPPEEFIEAHGAFAYVTNVPRPVVDGEIGSYDNPLHRHEVSEFVADVFSVPATNVFCANMNSAFVGFKDAKEAA